MFFGTHTLHRIKSTLNLYHILPFSFFSKFLILGIRIIMITLPLFFAYSKFNEFEFTIMNCLKFLGWFWLAHLILESIINLVVMTIIRIKMN